ncbi:MAG: hypothetical protein AVDCRST_MAG41-3265 [uncultured Corynebacteriales bacterium]|uniref:Sulfotransferase domain-containing protein n=1 Tax=uncultured Mycobacteriales bacterium TaxID=581187 RepID=A0A6J4JE38_9ACTN|nr:MAG: hypothetical protein AVDCRST_MAG41-3265 [uncultured Corynebacteriales bacterium]
MDAQVLDIEEKVAPLEFFPSVPANFRVAAAGTVPAGTVLGEHVELYCLDDARREAWFVDTGAHTDLAGVPFFYLAQYRAARRLLTVPYDTLHALAEDLPDPRVVWVHSTGRCGSTVLSRALNSVPGVRSLSEPDVYSDIAMFRHWGGPGRDEEYGRLVRSCTRLLGRHAPTLAVKLRGGAIHLGDLLQKVHPGAHNLFLYRHAERWAESMHAGFTAGLPGKRAMPTFLRYLESQAPLLGPWARSHGRRPTVAESYALTWLSIMDRYVTLREAGVPMLAVRYEELVAAPAETVLRILDWCELPTDGVDAVLATFATDSQEGTNLSRSARAAAPVAGLTADDLAQLRAVLAEHPVISTPDYGQ